MPGGSAQTLPFRRPFRFTIAGGPTPFNMMLRRVSKPNQGETRISQVSARPRAMMSLPERIISWMPYR